MTNPVGPAPTGMWITVCDGRADELCAYLNRVQVEVRRAASGILFINLVNTPAAIERRQLTAYIETWRNLHGGEVEIVNR